VTGPEQHAATVRDALSGLASAVSCKEDYTATLARVRDAGEDALDELVALAGRADELQRALESAERMIGRIVRATGKPEVPVIERVKRLAAAEVALRAVAAQPHAPVDGAGTDGAVHVYVQGYAMGCPICEAIETGLA